MPENGVEKGDGGAVMHQPGMHTHAPKRRGADFVGCAFVCGYREISPADLVHPLAVVFSHGLNNAVACAHVVKQEVAVGMKLLPPESIGNGEGATVDLCA